MPWQINSTIDKSKDLGYYLQHTLPLLENKERHQVINILYQQKRDLSFILLVDSNGKILVHTDPRKVGHITDDPELMHFAKSGQTAEHLINQGVGHVNSHFQTEPTLDILIPYYDANHQHAGAIKLGISLNAIETLEKQYQTLIIFLGLILFVFIIMITLRHLNSVLVPLSTLSEASKDFANGHLTQLTLPKRNDELGMLTREFNHMSRKLATSINDLKAKERELQEYIDSLTTLNGKLSPDGTLLMANRSAVNLLDLPAAKLTGKKFWETPWLNNNPQTRDFLKGAVAQAANGNSIQYEIHSELSSGKKLLLDFSLTPIFNESKEVIYLVAEGRDISLRKQYEQDIAAANEELTATNEELVATNEELVAMEEQLRATNEELYEAHTRVNTILESITDAFFAVNHQYAITYLNTEAEKLLARNKNDLLGKILWAEFPDTFDGNLEKMFSSSLDEQKFVTFEYYYKSVGKWFDIHVFPSREGLSIYFHDITSTKRDQEKIQLHNKYLESLHETTLALMNRLNLDELLEAIITRAGELLGTSSGWIYLERDDKTCMEMKFSTGIFKDFIGISLTKGEGMAGKVWQSGQPLIVNDYENWSGRSSKFMDIRIYSIVAVPLKRDHRVVGAIGLATQEEGRMFSEAEVKLLTGFARLASIALDNARLYYKAQQELAERTR
ncbi:hypothetical protein N752_15205 [Desulforamulus aquiferis]|nr:GAF domain-containing protein [Desulforamulus aquiferis]RYD04190.1 hypothetical protein N752_15205 [Desulforamulus aquiferis]